MPETVLQEYIEAPITSVQSQLEAITEAKPRVRRKTGPKPGKLYPSKLMVDLFRVYSDPKSKTYLDAFESAKAVGYTEKSARQVAWRIRTKYSDPKYREELALLCGVSAVEATAVLGATLRSRDSKSKRPDKIALLGARAALAMNGVPTSDQVAVEHHHQTIKVDKLLVIGSNGATEERLKALTGSKDVSV